MSKIKNKYVLLSVLVVLVNFLTGLATMEANLRASIAVAEFLGAISAPFILTGIWFLINKKQKKEVNFYKGLFWVELFMTVGIWADIYYSGLK